MPGWKLLLSPDKLILCLKVIHSKFPLYGPFCSSVHLYLTAWGDYLVPKRCGEQGYFLFIQIRHKTIFMYILCKLIYMKLPGSDFS